MSSWARPEIALIHTTNFIEAKKIEEKISRLVSEENVG